MWLEAPPLLRRVIKAEVQLVTLKVLLKRAQQSVDFEVNFHAGYDNYWEMQERNDLSNDIDLVLDGR